MTPKLNREQRAWCWYDWANSAFVTTTLTVIIGPYLTSLATSAACPGSPAGSVCTSTISLLGISILPGSLAPYLLMASTLLAAVVMVFVGALADRSGHPVRWLASTAWTGAAAAGLMYFLDGSNWQLGTVLLLVANVCFGSSLVVYDGLLCRIATPDERDNVSSRGWALGYLGGGLLLVVNLAMMSMHDRLGLSYAMAIRLGLLSAGLWAGFFTLIPVLGLRHLRRDAHLSAARTGDGSTNPVGQLIKTFNDLRNYPQTVLFLFAYVFINDGMQTLVGQSSLYASTELQMNTSQIMVAFLIVQIIAFVGALLFGRLAAHWGARKTVLSGIAVWLLVVGIAYITPGGIFEAFLGLGVLIGIVLGGTQALSRSMFSQLVPAGREAQYFSFYQAMERGTSWTGSFLFGFVFQMSHSYRWSILALFAFFLVGGVLLARVNVRQGIVDAGNRLPRLV